MEHYDTIIIGAGLSGCVLGKLLLEKKQKVLILEKKDIKLKSKLCGGLITEKSYNLLKNIYGDSIEKIKFKQFNEFKVKNNNVDLIFKDFNLYSIFREELDNFVLEQFVQSGGKIIDKTLYERIDFRNNILYANGKEYKYTNLVGADGVFSKVRMDLIHKQQEKNFALEAYIKRIDNNIQIYFLEKFNGYAWAIPNCRNTILGIGDVSKRTNIKEIFVDYFSLDENNTKIKGAFLPTGNDILLGKQNVFFIGDAAGLISPITGEGIYYSLISAYNLSNSINSYSYIKSMKKEVNNIKIHILIKKFVYNSKLRNYLFKKYEKSKVITKIIRRFIKTIL